MLGNHDLPELGKILNNDFGNSQLYIKIHNDNDNNNDPIILIHPIH